MSDRAVPHGQSLEDGAAGGYLVDPVQDGTGRRLQQGLEDRFQFRANEAARGTEYITQVIGACAGGALPVPVEAFDGPALGAETVDGGVFGPAGLAQGLALGGPAAGAEEPAAAGARLGLGSAVSAQRLAGSGAVVDALVFAAADARGLLSLLGAAGKALGGVCGSEVARSVRTAGRAEGGGDLPAGGADSAVVGTRVPEAHSAADAAQPMIERVVLAAGAAHGLAVEPPAADRSRAAAGRAGRDLASGSALLTAAQSVTTLFEVGGALAERARGDDHAVGAAIDQCLGQNGDLGWSLGTESSQWTGGVFQRPQQPKLAGAGAFDRAYGLLCSFGRDAAGAGGDQLGQFPGRVCGTPGRIGPAAGSTGAVASGKGGASADHAGVGAPEAAVAAGAADTCAVTQAGQRTLAPAVAAPGRTSCSVPASRSARTSRSIACGPSGRPDVSRSGLAWRTSASIRSCGL